MWSDFLISHDTPSDSKPSNEDADVIRQTMRDILVLVENMPLHEVCNSYYGVELHYGKLTNNASL